MLSPCGWCPAAVLVSVTTAAAVALYVLAMMIGR